MTINLRAILSCVLFNSGKHFALAQFTAHCADPFV